MSWALVLQVIESVAVTVGVIFGLVQLRQWRHQREVQAGLEMLAPMQTPVLAETVLLIHNLPDNLNGDELRRRLGEKFGSTVATLALFESLGPIVARGHVPLEMYAEFYRGPTLLCWVKFRRFIEEERAKGWPTLFEWLQWLAERMEQRPQIELPAYERFAGWKSSKDFARLSGTQR